MAADVWDVDLEEERSGAADHRVPDMRFRLRGPGFDTRTDIVLCDWSDTIARYSRRPAAQRLFAGLAALADFGVSGTAFRYFRVSWRYGLFYLYPLLLLLVAFGVVAGIAILPLALGWSALNFLWSLPLAVIALAFLATNAVRRLHFLTLMDDWAFARAFVRGTDPAIAERIAAHAADIGRWIETETPDEIVVAGHSLGVSLGVLALAQALRTDRPHAPLNLLTVGASLLKTALHPAATEQREAVRALVAEHGLRWVDVQSLSDPLNFYRSNPARSLGIEGGPEPIVKRISLGKLVHERSRKRLRRDPFRRHRQFVYGTERRHAYSFHMILIGPVGFERFAQAGSVDLPPLPPAPPVREPALPEVTAS